MSSVSGDTEVTRVLLLPSSGMGHLLPFVRLAGALSARRISVSILAARPTISAAESKLLSSLPPSLLVDFPLSPLDPSLFPTSSSDPFFLQMEALRRSSHLLPPLISALSPPVSSLIVDITIASSFLPVATLPCFVFFTSSASMLALCSVSPFLSHPPAADVDIAGGIIKIPISSLPPPLLNPNHLFTAHFVENGRALTLADGILVNTFSALEPEALTALNAGEVVPSLPPVIALGPFPSKTQPSLPSPAIHWLDAQPENSVLYVSFGSRTAMSKEQIGELAAGLEASGRRFLWVVKSAKVDREEETEIEQLLGEAFVERVGERGFVLREWVEQEAVLAHRAVGGFMSHCGWNSVVEAAAAGVRILAWPRMGDQRVNAAVVGRSGVGTWPEKWAWEADGGIVAAEEIAVKVREVMGDEKLAETALMVAAEAAAAIREGGSSDRGWRYLVTKL